MKISRRDGVDPGRTEEDVPRDKQQALSRYTGGVPDPGAVDQASTTGTTPKGDYVGRIAGDDIGFFEESGAERRAEYERQNIEAAGSAAMVPPLKPLHEQERAADEVLSQALEPESQDPLSPPDNGS